MNFEEYAFWTDDPNIAYGDGIPIPRVTYRCKGSVKRNDTFAKTTHQCKLVTDHPTDYCLCICGQRFNEKEEALV